jgi:uncharacterized protein YecE (DUF72 family)
VIAIGVSGYDYENWRAAFYPEDLPRSRWLEYASRAFASIELNGTFYSLKTPATYERWAREAPEGFLYAVKGSRFLTHNLKLTRAEPALANFYASGVLALGKKTGPFLWQLPAGFAFNAERTDSFMRLLPMTSTDAAALAKGHDARVKHGALTEAAVRVAYRHAFEVRHPSYFHEEFYELLRRHRMAFVVADTAGKFPYAEEVTADFVYVRLHGSTELYVSGYSEEELAAWARRVRRWAATGRDVYVYFDNDAKVHAPHDAIRLAKVVAATRRERAISSRRWASKTGSRSSASSSRAPARRARTTSRS